MASTADQDVRLTLNKYPLPLFYPFHSATDFIDDGLAVPLLLLTPPPPERPVVQHQVRPAHRQEAGAVPARVGQGPRVADGRCLGRRGGHRVNPAAAVALRTMD